MAKVFVHRNEHLYPMYMSEENEALLRSFAQVESGGTGSQTIPHDELVKQIRGAEVILSNCGLGAKEITMDVLKEAGTVKMIVIGHNWNQFSTMDLQSIGIQLIEGSNVNTVSVAEWVLAASLMWVRKLHAFDARMKAGDLWCEPNRESFSGMLQHKRIGLIGFGRIGRYVSRLFKAFDTEILVYDDYVSDEVLAGYPVRRATLKEALSTSDIISLHLAIAPSTLHMIGKHELAMIRDGALFLNCARAAVYDENAFIAEMEKKRFSAVIDVFGEEPLALDSPLRKMDNVTITPHVGGYSLDMFRGCAKEAILTIKDYFDSKPVVNRKYV